MKIVIPGKRESDYRVSCGACEAVFDVPKIECEEFFREPYKEKIGKELLEYDHVFFGVKCPFCGELTYQFSKDNLRASILKK